MSTLLKKLLQVAVPVSAVAVMSMTATSAVAGISNTKHFLGNGSPGGNFVSAADTQEICVFCHTPHGGDTATPGVPLWNKKLPSAGSYSTYASTTMDALGTGAAGAVSIGSVSLACLSCHDGTQAMDNILNAPGSGLYDSTGGTVGGADGGRGYTWTGNARIDAGGLGKLVNGGGFIAALGTDLTNDHPIGISYCGWNGVSSPSAPAGDISSASCADKDFKTAKKVSGKQQWFIDINSDGAKQKTDLLLYTRTFAVGGEGPSVECASCHDPHTDAQATFMRTTNAASALCLACHDK